MDIGLYPDIEKEVAVICNLPVISIKMVFIILDRRIVQIQSFRL